MKLIIIILLIFLIFIILHPLFHKKEEFKKTKKICVVFACNKKYFDKFDKTCNELVTNGKYKGDICLIIDDDLKNDELLKSPIITENNVIIKHFGRIKLNKSNGCYLKLNLFKTYFKKWNFIFYIDSGMSIYNDITPILNEAKKNKLLAHSDAYPTYERKLKDHFKNDPIINKDYDLNINYFQSGIMLYDTKIIKKNTFTNLINLTQKYKAYDISDKHDINDQAYLSLYFIIIKPCWEQIRIKNENTYFYDYGKRGENFKYIMRKYDTRLY